MGICGARVRLIGRQLEEEFESFQWNNNNNENGNWIKRIFHGGCDGNSAICSLKSTAAVEGRVTHAAQGGEGLCTEVQQLVVRSFVR